MPIRPLIKPEQGNRLDPNRLWRQAEKRGDIESFQEQEVFSLSPEELDKCVYKLVNNTLRMAECQTHTKHFTHGFRLFPPHLYEIDKNGKILYRNDADSEWKELVPKKRTIDKKAQV